jgi:hypothetical protein
MPDAVAPRPDTGAPIFSKKWDLWLHCHRSFALRRSYLLHAPVLVFVLFFSPFFFSFFS